MRMLSALRMKRLLSIIISLGILVVLYWKIDFGKLLPVFRASDPMWMALSLAMVVPLNALHILAFAANHAAHRSARLRRANRLILVASGAQPSSCRRRWATSPRHISCRIEDNCPVSGALAGGLRESL
jgi:hypothetical protein